MSDLLSLSAPIDAPSRIATMASRWLLGGLLVLPVGLFLVRTVERPRYPVRGAVAIDGTPQAGVQVRFHDITQSKLIRFTYTAWTQSDGVLQFGNWFDHQGLPAGTYALTFSWRPITQDGEDRKPGEEHVAIRYRHPHTTPIRITVPQTSTEVPWLEIPGCLGETVSRELPRPRTFLRRGDHLLLRKDEL